MAGGVAFKTTARTAAVEGQSGKRGRKRKKKRNNTLVNISGLDFPFHFTQPLYLFVCFVLFVLFRLFVCFFFFPHYRSCNFWRDMYKSIQIVLLAEHQSMLFWVYLITNFRTFFFCALIILLLLCFFSSRLALGTDLPLVEDITGQDAGFEPLLVR